MSPVTNDVKHVRRPLGSAYRRKCCRNKSQLLNKPLRKHTNENANTTIPFPKALWSLGISRHLAFPLLVERSPFSYRGYYLRTRKPWLDFRSTTGRIHFFLQDAYLPREPHRQTEASRLLISCICILYMPCRKTLMDIAYFIGQLNRFALELRNDSLVLRDFTVGCMGKNVSLSFSGGSEKILVGAKKTS